MKLEWKKEVYLVSISADDSFFKQFEMHNMSMQQACASSQPFRQCIGFLNYWCLATAVYMFCCETMFTVFEYHNEHSGDTQRKLNGHCKGHDSEHYRNARMIACAVTDQ